MATPVRRGYAPRSRVTGEGMKKKAKPTKPKPADKDPDGFAHKIAELRAELAKLPADRQAQLMRELEADADAEDQR